MNERRAAALGMAVAVALAGASAAAASARGRPRTSVFASPTLPAACAVHIPLAGIPRHVTITRAGRHVMRGGGPLFLESGDEIQVSRPATFHFAYDGNHFAFPHARLELGCRALELGSLSHDPLTVALAVRLSSGRVEVSSGSEARRALVLTPEMLAFATVRGTHFVAERDPRDDSTKAWTTNELIVAARASDPSLRIDARITYTAISDRDGLRLDIWPFSISPLQRPTTGSDRLPAFWDDGRPCSVGCTPAGVAPGWPLEPFHEQHAIRAGINELRPANFHVAVDIEAHNSQPVYAIQSGYASIRYPGTGDVNVDVGRFYYWHINPTVHDGHYVVAYRTVIGRVLNGFYHVAFSEGDTADYLNPLRPGGSLRPYSNTEPPVIGVPKLFADGRVIVAAFGPQSFVATGFRYETPVLAPSSLAWRLYDSGGHALTGLEWAMRGSQNYPPSLKPVIFAPGAANPGFECFFTRRRCIPNWVYWLAGGETEPLPLSQLPRGRYRLTVYAWDWAGNTSALDYWFDVPLAHAAAPAAVESGPLNPQFDYDETGSPAPMP
jgi:hypothetical protein